MKTSASLITSPKFPASFLGLELMAISCLCLLIGSDVSMSFLPSYIAPLLSVTTIYLQPASFKILNIP
jgi:hypothetical protein